MFSQEDRVNFISLDLDLGISNIHKLSLELEGVEWFNLNPAHNIVFQFYLW